MDKIALLFTGGIVLGTGFLYRHKLAYWTSLPYTYYQIKNSIDLKWYNEIILPKEQSSPLGKLYLGALPLKQPEDMLPDLVHHCKINLVISVVSPFELESGSLVGGLYPIKTEDWEGQKIEQKIFASPDFAPLSQEVIKETVEELHQALSQQHNIYVHCKAGRGRSATVVVAYLMRYHHFNLEEGYKYVKKYRSQINLNKNQLSALEEYELNLDTHLNNQ